MARAGRSKGFAEERTSRTGFGKPVASGDAKSGRIELRTSARTKTLLQRAAAVNGKTVTEFVLEAGLGAAEKTLLDRQLFRLDSAQWDAFWRALDRPPAQKPRLRRLLGDKSVLE